MACGESESARRAREASSLFLGDVSAKMDLVFAEYVERWHSLWRPNGDTSNEAGGIGSVLLHGQSGSGKRRRGPGMALQSLNSLRLCIALARLLMGGTLKTRQEPAAVGVGCKARHQTHHHCESGRLLYVAADDHDEV